MAASISIGSGRSRREKLCGARVSSPVAKEAADHGKWVAPKSGKTFETINPANEEVLALTGNPLDFQRFVVGVAYQYNEYLRFAVDSQNLSFYHKQFGIPVGTAGGFGYATGTFNGRQQPEPEEFHDSEPGAKRYTFNLCQC
jgi:hypothetical protein